MSGEPYSEQIFYLGRSAEPRSASGLLPADIADFTGRGEELALLEGLAGDSSAVVTAIEGPPGVGKTAVAVHAAFKLRDAFPDGRLYADLRGYTEGQQAAEVSEVLAVFLRRLGSSSNELAADLDQQASLFREHLSSRKMLIILDNVATAAQVRSLLPETGSSRVLVISRGTLAELATGARMRLDVFPGEQAVELLTRLIGQRRAAAAPDAMSHIAALCGHLPLALCLGGQLLAAHRGWDAARLARLLSKELRRPAMQAAGDQEARSAFMVSYRSLRPLDAQMFRLLGLFPGPDFDGAVAGSLADLDRETAEQALDRLALARLVISDTDGRFRMHDLLQSFAREVGLVEDDDLARDEALRRLVQHFHTISGFLNSCIDPRLRPSLEKYARQAGVPLPTQRQAIATFAAELPNMLAVLALASARHQYAEVWTITEQMYNALSTLWRPGVMLSVYQLAVAAGRAAGDKGAEARALSNLGAAHLYLRQFDRASAAFQEAVAMHLATGDRHSEAETLNSLGNLYADLGQSGQAITAYQQALKIRQDIGARHGAGATLINIGSVYLGLGQADQATAALQAALQIHRETGDKRAEGAALTNLGVIHRGQLEFDLAITVFQQALQLHRETGDKHGGGTALLNLGISYLGLAQYDQAISDFRQALKLYRETGDKNAEGAALDGLGGAYWGKRQFDQAITTLQEALTIYQETGDRADAGATLEMLGMIYLDLQQPDQAKTRLTAAAEAFRESGENDTVNLVDERLAELQGKQERS